MVLLAAAAAACGGSTQAMNGTAPSLVAPAATASDGTPTLGLLKTGKGKGPHTTPTTGTTPDPDDKDADDDSSESKEGHGHGTTTIQIEGFTTSVDGECPKLTIVINNATVTTADSPAATEFQRATCEQIKAAGDNPLHLHIAAKRQEDESLVAVYVRMQGPKLDDGDDEEEEAETN